MKLRAVPIDMQVVSGVVLPNEPKIFEAAQNFCSAELVERPNLGTYNKSWLVVEVSDAGDIVRPLAIGGYQVVYDTPLFRSIDPRATVVLAKRMNDFFADQGFRGRDVFLHVSEAESPEQKCPQYEDTLKAFGARPAERYIVRIT